MLFLKSTSEKHDCPTCRCTFIFFWLICRVTFIVLRLGWTTFIAAGPQGALTKTAFRREHLHFLTPVWHWLVAVQKRERAKGFGPFGSAESFLWGGDVDFGSGSSLLFWAGSSRCRRGRRLFCWFSIFMRIFVFFFMLCFVDLFLLLLLLFTTITSIFPFIIIFFSKPSIICLLHNTRKQAKIKWKGLL